MIEDVDEIAVLEAVAEVKLSAPVSDVENLDRVLRAVCGALAADVGTLDCPSLLD